MKALVLGATGMIGGSVARALWEAGIAVRGLKRPTSPTWHLEDVPVEWVTGDLMDRSSLAPAFEGCRFLFHAAAYYPQHSYDLRGDLCRAVSRLRNVLSVAMEAGVEKMVFTSSLSTIGPPDEADRLADERDLYLPGSTDSVYFEVKYALESEVLRASANRLPAVVVNPTVVLGPGDVKPTTGALLVAVAKGRVPAWVPSTVNIVDVRDVAAAQVAALERGQVGQRYILGGHNVAVKQALTLAATLAGVRPPRREVSLRTVELLVGLAEGLGRLPLVPPPPLEHAKTMRHWRPLNGEKARRELGLESRPLAETFRDSLAWFRAHGYLDE